MGGTRNGGVTSDPSPCSNTSRRTPGPASSSREGHIKGKASTNGAAPGFLSLVSAVTSATKTIAETPAAVTEAAADTIGGGGGDETMNEWPQRGSRCDTVQHSESLKSEASSTCSGGGGGGGSAGRHSEDAAVRAVTDSGIGIRQPSLHVGTGRSAETVPTTIASTTTMQQPRRPSGEKPSKSSEGRSSRTQNLTPGRRESGPHHQPHSSAVATKRSAESAPEA